MSEPKTSKRERATNKIINLTGLGKGNSNSAKSGSSGHGQTQGFPSFRFSPESEEIQEVLTTSASTGALRKSPSVGDEDLTSVNGDALQRQLHSESVPSSPRATGGPGEVSPLKEYIRKSWANKFDKKALSLDLDQRGRKIITAIEDKRKSIVSHFIPEEGLVLPSTVSQIPEHKGEVSNEPETRRVFTFDNSTQQVSSNITQSTKSGDSSSTASTIEDYEEIGIDYLANMDDPSIFDPLSGGSWLEYLDSTNYFTWSKSADSLREPELGTGVRGESESPVDVRSGSGGGDGSNDPAAGPEILPVFSNMFHSIVCHPWTKYLMALLALGLFVPWNSFFLSVYWFINGIIFSSIIIQSLTETPDQSERNRNRVYNFFRKVFGQKSRVETKPHVNVGVNSQIPTTSHRTVFQRKTQEARGWMLSLDTYVPKQSFRVANPVFLNLEGPNLCISYPSPRARVAKRRYWNDPPNPPDVKFVRFSVFNISGAEIFIAPAGLAKNRVWNKKYPIGITLPNACLVSNVTPVGMKSTFSDGAIEANSAKPTLDDTPSQADKTYLKGDKEVTREDWSGKTFFLYSRTSREKDDWFRRFVKAAKVSTTVAYGKDSLAGPEVDAQIERVYMDYMRLILPNMDERMKTPTHKIKTDNRKTKTNDKGSKASPGRSSPDDESPGQSSNSRNTPDTDFTEIDRISTIPQNPEYLNAFLGRIFFDFLKSEFWKTQIKNLIQKKLNYIKKPPFMEHLIVKDLYLGNCIPIIHGASTPVIDGLGLWIDVDITYDGTFCVTLETKINLMKLRKSPTIEEEPGPSSRPPSNMENPENDEYADASTSASVLENMYDSDADDSGESSEEESSDAPTNDVPEKPESTQPDPQPSGTGSSMSVHLNDGRGGKFMRMMEKMANSNFVSEIKVVKKAIAGVANTPLMLTVEVQSLSGTVALNIPPPPTNRLWFGFRTKPVLKLSAKPKFGDRTVNLTHVTDWIQAKIDHEASRILVLPNMDDLSIPLLDFKLPS